MQLLLWTFTENTEMDLGSYHHTALYICRCRCRCRVGVGCIQVWVEVWCRYVSLPVTQTYLTNTSNVSTLLQPIMQLSTFLPAYRILMGKGLKSFLHNKQTNGQMQCFSNTHLHIFTTSFQYSFSCPANTLLSLLYGVVVVVVRTHTLPMALLIQINAAW